ncbi:hypothetical protein B0T10DRAFT_481127 [Thelonectria olida]|uniref:ER transporter 6TM N-terminal domain-containing protein n=1 Tax=Thelonectria olida TaxID=1576542 RepID=A0A9P8W7A5_9HYPO|nr:hypothetical protein B0T10DRAFT_481127 [Thelonectria olida]
MSSSDREESPGSKADEKMDQEQQRQIEDRPETVENPYFVDATEASSSTGRKLPPWLDHFNAKDLKRLFKCSLAVWIMTLLIIINPTLKAIGRSAFLGCIVLFIAPPAGIVFIQLITAVTIILGVCAGWAWGAITMKAALATRPQAEMQARYGQLMQQAQNATNPAAYAKVLIFNGFMLDTRVSITYFCMMGLFIYFIALLRVAFPKLLLVQILGSIVSVIYLTSAPLLPTFNGTLAKVIVIPCAIAAGIGIVCNVFVFPTSSTSEALDGMRDVLQPMPNFLDACLLGLKHPGLDMSEAKLTGLRIKVLSSYKAIEPLFKFLPIDLSIGRWGAEDLSSLNAPFRQLVISFIGLTEVHRQKQVRKEKTIQALTRAQATLDETNGDQREVELGRHQIDQAIQYHVKANVPNRNNLIKKSVQSLAEPGEHLVEALKESIEAIGEALSQAHVLKKAPDHPEMLQRHVTILSKLRAQREVFMTSTSRYLPETSRQMFNENGLLRLETGTMPSLTGFMLGILLQERLYQLAGSLEALLTRIVELEGARVKVRVWLPSKLTALFQWIGHEDPSEDKITAADIGDNLVRIPTVTTLHPHLQDKSESPDVHANSKSARAELVTMRMPNSRKRSRGGRILLVISRWLGNDEGIFALRMVILSLALSVPAVVRDSCGFFYRNRGLWAVIMAQLSLVPYTADLLYGVLVRAFGTVVGGVIGMTAWYIGAGGGPGNPYGMAAILVVVILIMMWWRLFAPPALIPAGILMGATAYLVVGYSWMDTHSPAYGNPGVGYVVFWRRLLLVFIGFGGTLIVNFLPSPPSANRHYRHLLADTLVSIRDRYALFASNWRDPAPDLHEVVEEEAIAVGEALLTISGPIKLTVLEFSSSNFDTKTLTLVCNQCMLMNQNVTQLLLYTTYLSEEQRIRIIPATGATTEDLITELMAVLSLVQQALKSGDPLPAVLPTPLFTKAIAHARRHVEEGMRDSTNISGKELLDCEGMRRYIVILNSLVQLLAALDELVLILKRAVGETSNIAVLETV